MNTSGSMVSLLIDRYEEYYGPSRVMSVENEKIQIIPADEEEYEPFIQIDLGNGKVSMTQDTLEDLMFRIE